MIDIDDVAYEDRMSADTEDCQDHGWPGDGIEMNFLAEHHGNTEDLENRDDIAAAEDSDLDRYYEDRTDIGLDY